MLTRTRSLVGAVVVAAAMAAMILTPTMTDPASAQVVQDGLVNVNIGDVTILEDVTVALAANVAANICGVTVNVVALATQVDRTGNPETICTIGGQRNRMPVTITNN